MASEPISARRQPGERLMEEEADLFLCPVIGNASEPGTYSQNFWRNNVKGPPILTQ